MGAVAFVPVDVFECKVIDAPVVWVVAALFVLAALFGPWMSMWLRGRYAVLLGKIKNLLL